MGLFSIRIRTLAIGFVLFVVSWFLLSFLLRVDFIHALHETSEAFIYNQIFASRARPSEDVILLDEGQNEHSRQHYGNLIASLDAAGAKVIALDVLFNAERDSAQNILLITSTRKASRKIIHATEFIGIDNDEIIPHRYHLRTLGNCPVDFERANGVLLPFRDLLKAIKHLGHITHTASMTGREEHYFQPVICYNDRLYPSLPLLAVMKFRDCPTDTLPHAPEEDVVVFKSDTIDTQSIIPINHRGQALINFIPKKEFLTRTYLIDSVRSLIMREPTIFNNKIVLIGNSFDSQEQSNGPHFETYPNLIIYATLISQMLRGENIREGILESILYSLALLALWLVGLTFMSERLEQFKLLILRLVGQMLRLEGFERFKFWPWEYYALAFLFFLIVAALNLLLGIRIYIILPYVAFCASSLLSKRYYEKRLGDLIGTKKRIKYLDYYLLIGPKRKQSDTYPVFLIDSPAGEDFCELKLLLKEEEVKKFREDMAQNFKLETKRIKEFGAALFEALFQPEIRDQYYKSLGIAFTQNSKLRIKLRIDAPDLISYPWEYLYDNRQAKDFLALHQNISVTRFLAIAENVPIFTLKPPLRILVIISNPIDRPQLVVEDEERMMKKALRNLESNGIARLRFLQKATFKELTKELHRRVDVIHFIGHGGYSESLEGGLVFESDFGRSEFINIDRLGKLLETKPIRLVVLNACRTAQASESEIAIGVAQGLVKIGVPAVVAMQSEIRDDSAIEFSNEFYTELAATFQVDRAVSEARRKMFIGLESGRIDWGIPVLFMRKDDGIIFRSKE